MTAKGNRAPRGVVVKIGNSEFRIGPKWIVAALIAGAIVWLGVWVSPTNGWAGVGIATSGILGAVLGLLIQPDRLPPDRSLEARSAVRGLLDNADSVENVARLTTQLASGTTDERVAVGLVTAQDDLIAIREKMFLSMAEWDTISPGATDEVKRLQDAGAQAFNRLRSQPDV